MAVAHREEFVPRRDEKIHETVSPPLPRLTKIHNLSFDDARSDVEARSSRLSFEVVMFLLDRVSTLSLLRLNLLKRPV